MDVQGYALLKYYAELGTLTDGQYKIADGLLLEYTCQNQYFGFYKKLDERLVVKYHLQDKYFVEYHTRPGTYASISYYINDESLREEELVEVYAGIYVKSFILFFGDKLSYYISENKELEGRRVTESGQLENHDVYAGREQSRYALLNEMFMNATIQETDTLKELMKEYSSKKESTEKLFKLL